jgi:integrase
MPGARGRAAGSKTAAHASPAGTHQHFDHQKSFLVQTFTAPNGTCWNGHTLHFLLPTIRLFFNWCVDRGLIDVNPCARLKMPAKKVSRDRVLSDAEILRIWNAARSIGYPFGTIAQLLLLTAQRRKEVTTLRWSDLNLEAAQWSIPGELTKNGIAHVVPLVPEVIDILKHVPRIDDAFIFPSRSGRGRTFSGFSRSKERLAALACVEEFTLHDLRRTTATRLAGLGVAPHVIERLLNHVTGVLGGVAGVYNRFKYRDEVREALALWTAYVQLCSGWRIRIRLLRKNEFMQL